MKTLVSLMGLLSLIFCSSKQQKVEQTSIYDFRMKDIHGKEKSLSVYKGKVILIVNVASKCGLTGQYEGLEKLYQSYRDRGFVILGFPANDFAGQEPGTNEEILSFCTKEYNVTFDMFSKIAVAGKDKHELYHFLTEKINNNKFDAEVSWNFQKFLIARDGSLVQSFAPKVSPDNADLLAAIEAELAKE